MAKASVKTAEAAAAQWAEDNKGIVMRTGLAEIFDGLGVSGVYDVLNNTGIKSVPSKNAIPWSLITNSGVVTLIWPEGRVSVLLTASDARTIFEAKDVVKCITENFAVERVPAATFAAEATTMAIRVRYGVQGVQVMQKAVGFR